MVLIARVIQDLYNIRSNQACRFIFLQKNRSRPLNLLEVCYKSQKMVMFTLLKMLLKKKKIIWNVLY